MPASTPRSAVANRLLAALPRDEYDRLRPDLGAVQFSKSKVIYETGDTARHIYFVQSGLLSLLSTTQDGEVIEVGMVGNEGVVGLPALLGVGEMPYRVMAQLPAVALRIKAEVLRAEFKRGDQLQSVLLRYTHVLLTQLAQSAVCNHYHTVEQRLARWLLVSRDRVHSDTFHLTHDLIANMLGVPRTGVTMAAGALQRARLISYSRGKITILDEHGLEAAACECYQVYKKSSPL